MRTLLSITGLALFSLGALAAEPATDVASDPPPDTVLVRKGDVTVTAGDFLANMDKLAGPARFSYRADLQRITNNVSGLFVTRELANEARAQGIDKEPEVQRRIRLAEEAVLAQVDMERFEKTIVTPDFEPRARELYKANPARFERPAAMRGRRIVVSLQGRTEEEAKRRAQEAVTKLAAGEPIGAVTREYSNDPNLRINNGVYEGPYNLLPDEVAAVAKTAPLKTVMGPIRTASAYEVLMVEERVPAFTVPFDKAKGELISLEQDKFRKAAIDEKLKGITNDKSILIDTDAIASLQTHPDIDKIHEMAVERMRKSEEFKSRIVEQAGKGKTD